MSDLSLQSSSLNPSQSIEEAMSRAMNDDMAAYKAYLTASRMAEYFLLAHAHLNTEDGSSYNDARGNEQFEKLAAMLGYRVEKDVHRKEAEQQRANEVMA